MLSAILHIGNITFKQANNIRTSEECVVITDKTALDIVAKLLSVNADLLKEALTTKKSFARGEQFVTHYKRVDVSWKLDDYELFLILIIDHVTFLSIRCTWTN